jgi:ABC-type multidrug transport system ATPase subunit/pSer/pThr/pTyr-binding forkhead associated (FHA) protein
MANERVGANVAICGGCSASNPEGATQCVQCHAPLDSGKSPCLVGLRGAFAGKVFPIEARGLRVGRTAGQNELAIVDPEVSRQHAYIEAVKGAARLVDRGSPNGTFVDGRRVTEAALAPGNVIRFGLREENSFVYRAETMAAAAGAAASSPQVSSSGPPATIFMAAGSEAEAPPRRLQLVLDQYAVKDIPIAVPHLEFGSTEGPGKLQIDHPSIAPRHAELLNAPDGATLRDLGSAHGTLVNGEKIRERVLQEGDLLQFGTCDTHLFLYRESRTRVNVLSDVELNAPVVTIGRARSNRIHLEHPTVSGRHAEVRKVEGGFELVDLGSTNGTFVNGQRIGRRLLQPRDRIGLGAVQFVFDGAQMEQQSDGTRIRLSARTLRVEVIDFRTGAPLRLLDDVSLAIEPREFVGLLGPSGAGKTTLMDALSGLRPAQQGSVQLNSANLYGEYEALRALIGYLPQEDILHRQLTVRECLYYSARLRLPDDFGESEIADRVSEVMQQLELTERAGLTVAQLSGGQRKRVSLGIELLSKPALLFLDEPTAGQDPHTEMKLMQLFREIANRGSTVIINTHLLGSFSLLDKAAVLIAGKVAYFGRSQDMLPYFCARRPRDIYDRLQEKKPEEWAAQYRQSASYRECVGDAGSPARAVLARAAVELADAGPTPPQPGEKRPARHSALRQLGTLLARQFTLKWKDKATIVAAVAPPVVIALLTGLTTRSVNEPKVLFMMVLVALWFGCSASVREIVDELPVFRRERQRDLKLSSYLGSKLIYLAVVAVAQTAPLVFVLVAMGAIENHLPACLFLIWLLTFEGGLIGLLISSIFSTAEKALYVFPLTMIPQLLLAGLLMPVAPIVPFFPRLVDHHVAIEEAPPEMAQPAMTPFLRYVASPLMVSRWGLEGLNDLYIHDNEKYSYYLLNFTYITLHPHDAAQARARLERMQMPAKAGSFHDETGETESAFPAYVAILGGFALLLASATAVALKWKESHAS